MVLNKGDFVEVEFTALLKDGDVFDSNVKSELEKLHAGHEHPVEAKPFVFALGEGMFLKGVEDFLIGKDVGKHKISLEPEKAFGKRNSELIKMIPLKKFLENKMNPIPGSVFEFDGRLAKVLTVTSGRVVVDFNNPLAGKNVEYSVNVLRKVDDRDEKIRALNELFLKKNFDFTVDGTKLILDAPKEFEAFVKLVGEKYQTLLGLTLELKKTEEKKD